MMSVSNLVKVRNIVLCAVGFLLSIPALVAQAPFDVKQHYEKHEYQIPMRDGVKLFTIVYTPRDTTRDYPFLFTRTPYSLNSAGGYGPDKYARTLGFNPEFALDGYIFVYQDVRGRYMSEGTFIQMTPHKDVKQGPNDVDESSDTYDTIDWLIKHVEHNNGRVGMRGISYPGYYAAYGAIAAHPALKAVSPQAPQMDWFAGDDTHHNGAFFLVSVFDFMSVNGRSRGPVPTSKPIGPHFNFGTPDGYQFFLDMGPLSNANARYLHDESPGWSEQMEHSSYDQFWKDRNLLPHFRDIRPAVMSVGGWYDTFDLYGALHLFKAIEQQSPATHVFLVMGPWSHGQWGGREDGDALGPLRFGSKTSDFFKEKIEFPFFQYYLKDKADPKLPTAYIFETGTNRWRTFDHWPPQETKPRSIYLREGASLSFEPPKNAANTAFDEYISDPSKPVPFVAGLSTQMDWDYMTQDQRFSANRPDVLVYKSEPLSEDLTIAGPITPSLFVSTSGTDSDWIVKLIDVFPVDAADVPVTSEPPAANQPKQVIHMGGFQQLVRGDVLRGKFRNSLEKPEPFVPGKVTDIEFVMPDVLHTFRKGHRIMVHVQSTWFPLVDRNPQKFVDIYHASESDFHKATERVYHAAGHNSRIMINVLPRDNH